MKNILITIFILATIILSCKKEEINPNDVKSVNDSTVLKIKVLKNIDGSIIAGAKCYFYNNLSDWRKGTNKLKDSAFSDKNVEIIIKTLDTNKTYYFQVFYGNLNNFNSRYEVLLKVKTLNLVNTILNENYENLLVGKWKLEKIQISNNFTDNCCRKDTTLGSCIDSSYLNLESLYQTYTYDYSNWDCYPQYNGGILLKTIGTYSYSKNGTVYGSLTLVEDGGWIPSKENSKSKSYSINKLTLDSLILISNTSNKYLIEKYVKTN